MEATHKFAIPDINPSDREQEWLDFQVSEVEPELAKDPEKFWGIQNDNMPQLVKVMRCFMILPHSNASSERMFSILKKFTQNSELVYPTVLLEAF